MFTTHKKHILFCSLLLSIFFISTAHSQSERPNQAAGVAYVSDYKNAQVFVVDLKTMALKKSIDTEAGPYPVDIETPHKTYAITRLVNSIDIINNFNYKNIGRISLQHKPRSTAYNKSNGLVLIGGIDKPMSTLVRAHNNKIIQVVGHDEPSQPDDFGGSLATGHPFWVNKHQFLLIDRAARMIQLYNKAGNLLSEVSTPTAVHHIIKRNRALTYGQDRFIYYAVAEGNQNEPIAPALLQLKIKNQAITLTGQLDLNGFDLHQMGGHHAGLHPDGIHIYMPSAEGHVFVINRHTMTIVTVIETGSGSGHVFFAPKKGKAVVINHNDSFITIIDTVNHQKITNVAVADLSPMGRKSQGHTATFSPDQRYFYGLASDEGTIFEFNMDNLTITRRLDLGGYTLMSSFNWE